MQLITHLLYVFGITVFSCVIFAFHYHLTTTSTKIPDQFQDLNVSNLNLSRHYPKRSCLVCDFAHNGSGLSTMQDAVIGISNQMRNVVEFIRSLRSVGCRATFLLFCSASIFEIQFEPAIADCGIWTVLVDNFNFSTATNILVDRFQVYYSFLKANPTIFRRLLLADIGDTFFQNDPFDSDFHEDQLHFSLEPVWIEDCTFHTLEWLKGMLGFEDLPAIYRGKYVVCGGLIAGGYRPIITYLQLYARWLAEVPLYEPGFDQAFANVIAYNSTFCGDLFPDCRLHSFDTGKFSSGHFFYIALPDAIEPIPGHVIFPGQKEPTAVLHHFNRHPALLSAVTVACQERAQLISWPDSYFE